MVKMDRHIKSLGESMVKIHLYKDIISELKVVVNKEVTGQKKIETNIETPSPVTSDETENEITTD
jgi:hypothetical protein